MPPDDQTSSFQSPEILVASDAMIALSGGASPLGDVSEVVHQRSAYTRDDWFPFDRVRVFAWDVVCHGRSDLSTMLFRRSDGGYFLRCRSGDQPDVAASIVPLSDSEAAAWFDRLPVHFAPRDARW